MQTEMNKDPMNVAATNYKLLLENDKVRVMHVIFQPGETAKLHHHPDHVIYIAKGGRMKMVSEGKTEEMELQEGSAVFLQAQDHEATNIGNSEIELIVTELKK